MVEGSTVENASLYLPPYGEMSRRFQEKDWTNSSLGEMKEWPRALCSSIEIALASSFPMAIWWGPQFCLLYNDGYRDILGGKHPHSLGEPAAVVWPEIWEAAHELLNGVVTSRRPKDSSDDLWLLKRNGYVEECYFTYSHSPIRLDDGTVGGVFTAINETSKEVISRRRIKLLRDVAARVTDADMLPPTVKRIMEACRTDEQDLPFVALYLSQQNGFSLSGSTRILPTELTPPLLTRERAKQLLNGEFVPTNIPASFDLKADCWNELIREAFWLPLTSPERSEPFGLIYVGINPRRSVDDDYQNFLKHFAGQVSSAIISSLVFEEEKRKSADLAKLMESKTAQFTQASKVLERTVEEKNAELKRIGNIISDFVVTGDFRQASKELLRLALEATGSEYGFVGATVPGGPHGQILRVFADLGFEWKSVTNRELYEKIMSDYETKGYIDFPMLDNLFGWPILNKRPLIANEPKADPRRSGRQPAGHPPMETYLGLPIMKGDTVVGAFGIANRPGGYSQQQLDELDHLAQTASVIYESYKRLQNERQILQERELAEENLKRANEALLEMAHSVSHELQEPLAVLKGDLSLLSARYKDRLGTDADRFIANALECNKRIGRMIDDLWTFARIEKPHLEFEPVDLTTLFDKSVIAVKAELNMDEADISHDSLPTLRVQKDELANLFRQLLLNAFMHNRNKPKIHLSATQLVNEWLFCLSDNGVGFEPTETHEVFKMFRKLKRDSEGTGMGLPIAKRIVEFHKGRIWAESATGQGAKFYFTIPIVAAR